MPIGLLLYRFRQEVRDHARNGWEKENAPEAYKCEFQPSIPTSMGRRPAAHNDQAVKKATIVPMPAPERKSPAASGKSPFLFLFLFSMASNVALKTVNKFSEILCRP